MVDADKIEVYHGWAWFCVVNDQLPRSQQGTVSPDLGKAGGADELNSETPYVLGRQNPLRRDPCISNLSAGSCCIGVGDASLERSSTRINH